MSYKTMLLRLAVDISAVHDKTFYCFRFSSLYICWYDGNIDVGSYMSLMQKANASYRCKSCCQHQLLLISSNVSTQTHST